MLEDHHWSNRNNDTTNTNNPYQEVSLEQMVEMPLASIIMIAEGQENDTWTMNKNRKCLGTKPSIVAQPEEK